MKLFQYTIAILFAFSTLNGLSIQPKGEPNLEELLYNAESAFYDENYRKAIDIYFKLDSIDPDDHGYYIFQIGLAYLYSNLDNELALSYLEEGFPELMNSEIADISYFNMAQAYHTNYMFDQAIEYYEKVLEMVEESDEFGLEKAAHREIAVCKNAKELVAKPLQARVKSVGNAINSEFPDYKAVVTADESEMFFTSRKPGSTGDKVDLTGRYYEDIYRSERDQFGYWSYPTHISDKINSDMDEATIGLSVDGTKLYIYKGEFKGGQIYTSVLEGEEWTKPAPVEGDVNTRFWETSASISADGKTIYFVSDKNGGTGLRDIYKATKNEDGTWSDAKNLGSTINTVYDEDTPFIHPDGKTLYFSSRGHNTMGGFDVFKSVYENGAWSEPVNMGYPINSTCDDFHFVTNAKGTRGYFSSSRNGGMGEQDIYSIKIAEREVPLLLVRGNVITDRPDENISANMIITERTTKDPLKTIYQPNSETGKYVIILPPALQYDMVVKAKGYPDYETVITMPDVNEYHEFYQQIYLQNGEIMVQNLFMDLADSTLNDDQNLAAAAKANNREYLQTLTENIADEVEKRGANSINEIIPDENMDKVFDITDEVADNIKNGKVTDDFMAENGIDASKVNAGTSSGDLADGSGDNNNTRANGENSGATDNSNGSNSGTDSNTGVGDGNLTDGTSTNGNANNNQTGDNQSDSTNGTGGNNGSNSGTGTGTGTGNNNDNLADGKGTSDQGNNNSGQTGEGEHEAAFTFTVKFAFDKYTLEEKYLNDIEVIYSTYKRHEEAYLEIAGHTDSKGPESYNVQLSKRRAQTVSRLLQEKGVPADHIRIKALGESQPIAPNVNPDGSDNPQGRSENRRTEIKLVNH